MTLVVLFGSIALRCIALQFGLALPEPAWRQHVAERTSAHLRDVGVAYSKAITEASNAGPTYCEQEQDHFDPANNVTWCQHYFVNKTQWRDPERSPVFLCVGGEGPVVVDNSWYCSDMVEMASQMGALLLAVEHRFYVNSFPAANLSTFNLMSFLNSNQAAADLAKFHAFAVNQYQIGASARWILFGSSYSGALASWTRSLYPKLFYAAVASSSPVRAHLNFEGYSDVIATVANQINYDIGGSIECASIVRQGHVEIGEAYRSGRVGQKKLEEMFDVCECESLDNDQNMATFSGYGVIVIHAQDNDPACTESLCNTKKVCEYVIDAFHATGSALTAMAETARQQRQVWKQNCTSVTYNTTYMDDISNSNWHARSWSFQACSQFGFIQTCEHGSNCPYTKGYNTLEFGTIVCREHFGLDLNQMRARIDATNQAYGADHPNSTRVLYVNGGVDPWSFLSVLVSNGPKQPTLWVPGASHHFWTHPSKVSDSTEVNTARQTIIKTVEEWTSEPSESSVSTHIVGSSFLRGGRRSTLGPDTDVSSYLQQLPGALEFASLSGGGPEL